MGSSRRKDRAARSWRLLLGLLCVLLVVVSGTVQIAHTHADRLATHADCSLCVAAHITVQLAQTPVPAPPATVVAVLEALPSFILPSGLSTFALFTRPPPAV
jgi:hypothetical protein